MYTHICVCEFFWSELCIFGTFRLDCQNVCRYIQNFDRSISKEAMQDKYIALTLENRVAAEEGIPYIDTAVFFVLGNFADQIPDLIFSL